MIFCRKKQRSNAKRSRTKVADWQDLGVEKITAMIAVKLGAPGRNTSNFEDIFLRTGYGIVDKSGTAQVMSVHAHSIHFPCHSSLINIRLVRRDMVPSLPKLALRCRKTTFNQWCRQYFYLEGPFWRGV